MDLSGVDGCRRGGLPGRLAATCGFRGGRVFPAVFIAVALGFLVHAVVPGIPVPLAVASCVLGLTLAITRYGWLSLFMAAVLVPDPVILILMTIAVLPAWLLVTGSREMVATPRATAAEPVRQA